MADANARGEDEPSHGDETRRRRFLARLTLALTGLAAAVLAIPFVGLVLAPLRREDGWSDVGAVDDFTVGKTVKVIHADPDALPWAGMAGRSAAWLRRVEDTRFVAYSVYCTHVGCPVHWVETGRLFLCPCHGGAFDAVGRPTSGPPPRPLDRHDVRIRAGRVQVRVEAVPG